MTGEAEPDCTLLFTVLAFSSPPTFSSPLRSLRSFTQSRFHFLSANTPTTTRHCQKVIFTTFHSCPSVTFCIFLISFLFFTLHPSVLSVPPRPPPPYILLSRFSFCLISIQWQHHLIPHAHSPKTTDAPSTHCLRLSLACNGILATQLYNQW